ncbi:hypothetical protein VTP01DRAFT_1239 [Rhizomucor pusillus]|uniref:uncharacterized protein n=1 Tax=Rhizomucor pusillus TaxID=4840 RepID=UPI0037444C77
MKSEMSVQPHPDSGKSTTSQVAPGSPFPMLMLPQDDRLTFLLPRPVWVNDLDVTHCTACDAAFGPLRRRHHCRHCGNIFCNDCSSKSAPLPQLGYGSKPVRVCKNCFEVAYLVTYAVDDDHGLSTQIHGARGLLELIEKDNPGDLHSLVAYGGVDALVWLCRSSSSTQLHHLVTTILAILAEKESVRPVIITKWALPAVLHLIDYYVYSSNNKQETIKRKSPSGSIQSNNSGSPGNHSQITVRSTEDQSERARQEMILEIIINCTHIIYQLARAGILSSVNIIDEGALDALLTLAAYDPELARDDNQSTNSKAEQQEQYQLEERVSIIQSWAAKAVSAISGILANQPYVIDVLRGTNRFANLLRSSNQEVVKYMAKTIAYLSLRNDKYKAALLEGEVARALVSIIVVLPQADGENDDDQDQHRQDLCFYLSCNVDDTTSRESNPAAVSHACCALANFATNSESQAVLTSLPRMLKYICNVPAAFSDHSEIHRHIARCIANLALYGDNYNIMISTQNGAENENDAYNVIPTLLAMGLSANVTKDVQRHIVRAIDNLSAQVPNSEDDKQKWRNVFQDVYPYVSNILENSSDEDTLKRAQSIKDRAEAAMETKKKKPKNKKKPTKENGTS